MHYYHGHKSALAEAVLRRVAADTRAATSAIWRDDRLTLAQKFLRMRDWIHAAYLRFNPGGKGGRPWGLLSRFSMEADVLDRPVRRLLRDTLERQERDIGHAVEQAIARGELRADAPAGTIALQVLSVMHATVR